MAALRQEVLEKRQRELEEKQRHEAFGKSWRRERREIGPEGVRRVRD